MSPRPSSAGDSSGRRRRAPEAAADRELNSASTTGRQRVIATIPAEPLDGNLPVGELPDGELPDSDLPDGELPVGELPDGELPDGELDAPPLIGGSDESSTSDEESELPDERALSPRPPIGEASKRDLVYVLEVIQQPQRARACGFGDKDRRPLSPPPIVQLRIFDKLGKAIPLQAIDHHRFVLMVDLWNGDRTQQRSIVLHPGARPDQYALFTQTTARPTASAHRYEVAQAAYNRAPMRPATSSGVVSGTYGWQGQDWGHPQGPSGSFARSPPYPNTYGGQPSGPSTPGYPLGSSYHYRAPSRGSSSGWGHYQDQRHDRRPSSSASGLYEPLRSGGHGRGPPEAAPVERDHPQSGHTSYRAPSAGEHPKDQPYSAGPGDYSDWDRRHTASGRPWTSSGETQRGRSSGPLFTHHPSPLPHQSPLPMTASPLSASPSLYPDVFPDRLATTSHYSRVLVGSMGAVCQGLKDLNGDPGLFFFAHDLGIRTEGTFTLRFTLVDLNPLSTSEVEKGNSSNILARIYSNPFTVYSAKRFPGVLPTTDLTQCFADQSVRLPTRQKRGNSGGSNPKRKK